jgi:hypothetical protein
MKRAALLFAALSIACSRIPARYLEQAPAIHAHDDEPTAMPRRIELHQHDYLAEVYMRRPMMDALDASRFPDALDVNAMDEAVESTWFDPDASRQVGLASYRIDGPPRPPLVLTGFPKKGVMAVTDARGLPYTLRADSADRPEMRTAADAITSRIVWSLGYRTPEVHVVRLESASFSQGRPDAELWLGNGTRRVSATRWPIGIDLGPAPVGLTREDDPNDRVEHRNRRTLRALRVLGAWLDLRRLGPDKTIDAYVGPSGCGHVVHFLSGFEDALGTTRVSAPVTLLGPRPDCGPNPLMNVVTLGFAADAPPGVSQKLFHGLGNFDDHVSPDRYRPDLPPYEPADRMLPADGYWAARRIMTLPVASLHACIDGGALREEAAHVRLAEVLEARKRAVAAWHMKQVTPVRILQTQGLSLLMHDDSVSWDFADPVESSYRIEFVDDTGAALQEPRRMVPKSGCWWVDLPNALDGRYVVIKVTGFRAKAPLPRPAEFHVLLRNGSARLLGMRH